MAREVQPCGTTAAYQRHRRRKEDPCDDCARAWREAKHAKDNARRTESAEHVREAVQSAPATEDVDPLAEALDNLRIVRAVLQDGETPANTIAQLSRRRDELVDRVKRFQEAETPVEVSVIDELTSRRSERRSEATG